MSEYTEGYARGREHAEIIINLLIDRLAAFKSGDTPCKICGGSGKVYDMRVNCNFLECPLCCDDSEIDEGLEKLANRKASREGLINEG